MTKITRIENTSDHAIFVKLSPLSQAGILAPGEILENTDVYNLDEIRKQVKVIQPIND